MNIKLQPKIILGSLLGIFTSVVGFIAIFYPSVFNLEKKKIEEFTCIMETYQDCERLNEFLLKYLYSNKDSVFKLDVDFGKFKEVKKNNGKTHNPEIKEQCVSIYRFSYDIESSTKTFMLTDEELEVNRKPETLPILYGIEYIFVGMDMKKNMPERLHNRIEGYFTFDFQHARWGIVTVRFKRIPEEEILLKNYKG